MPEEPSEHQEPSRRKQPAASIDMDQILEFIRLDNERRSEEITLMAERLAQTLAKQLGESQGRGERLDEGRIRSYDVTRRQLAGPFDDEANTLGEGAIVSVTPHILHVGGPCRVLLRDAGQAVEVAFTSDDGTVAVRVADTTGDAGTGTAARSHQLVSVDVHEKAVTGSITLVTDAGILTSAFDVLVAAEAPADHLPDEVFVAQPRRGGER